MSSVVRSLLVVLSLIAGSGVQAFESKSTIRMGYESGGDAIGVLQISNGDSKTFRFGTGIFVDIGYEFRTPVLRNMPLSTELYLGWKYDGSELSNGKIDYTRYLVGAHQYYHTDRFRFGAGVAGYFNNKYEERGFNNDSFTMDNALGISLTADYRVSNRLLMGARMTTLEFSAPGATVDGSSVGVYIALTD